VLFGPRRASRGKSQASDSEDLDEISSAEINHKSSLVA
jgi:hypothetical protein